MNCSWLRHSSVLLLALSLLLIVACGGGGGGRADRAGDDTTDDDAVDDDVLGDDTSDDDSTDDDTTPVGLPFTIDFENYALGDPSLSGPWSIKVSGATTVQIADYPGKGLSGHALNFESGVTGVDYGEADLFFSEAVTGDFLVTFDIWLNNDASCYIGVSGVSGSGADVVANGYDDSLWAYHYQEGGGVMKAHCGTISDSTPVNLTVDVYASGSYSVLMNGAATDCTDLGLNGGAGGWYTDMWFADENGPNPCNAYFDNLHGESISE